MYMIHDERNAVLLPHVVLTREVYHDNCDKFISWLTENIGDEQYDWEFYWGSYKANTIILTFGSNADVMAFKLVFGEYL